MAVTHIAALSASRGAATEPCASVLRQLAAIAALGPPASSNPELLGLVQHHLEKLQASHLCGATQRKEWRQATNA